jgi:hypothetical protein
MFRRLSVVLLSLYVFCAPYLALAQQVPHPTNGPISSTVGNLPKFGDQYGVQLNDNGPLPDGAVRCWLDPSGGNTLRCRLPGGQEVDRTGSTTSGLEEGLRAACDSNLSFYIDGAGSGYLTPVVNLSTPLDMRSLRKADGSHAACPTQGKTISLGWVTLNWTTSQGASDGWVLDSIMATHIRFDGQTVYQGTGCAIAIVPTHLLVPDNMIAALDSELHLGHPGTQFAGAGCLLKLDAANGAILNLNISWEEMNGGGCPTCAVSSTYGIKFVNAAGHGIQENHFRGGRIHGFSGTGILLGQNSSDGTAIRGNTFDTTLTPSATSAIGADVWAGGAGGDLGNIFNLVISGDEMPGCPGACSTTFTGVKIEAGATGNIFNIPRNSAGTKVSGATADLALQEGLPFVSYTPTITGTGCTPTTSGVSGRFRGVRHGVEVYAQLTITSVGCSAVSVSLPTSAIGGTSGQVIPIINVSGSPGAATAWINGGQSVLNCPSCAGQASPTPFLLRGFYETAN